MCRLVMLSFKKRFGTSSVISDQASNTCAAWSVFSAVAFFFVDQLTFEIQYSDHSFI